MVFGIFEYFSNPLTEEIRLQIFGSRDLSVSPIDLLSDGDSVYSTEKVFGILGTPVSTCLICVWTPVKTCEIIWQLSLFEVGSFPSVDSKNLGGKHSAASVCVKVRYDVNIYVCMSSYEGGEM